MTNAPVVRLYGKPGCHLCEDAEAILARVSQSQAITVQQINVESSAALFDEYRYRIPVIEVVGGQTLDWPTTPERVRRAIQAAAASPARQSPGQLAE